jgi:hypothetical protein
MRTRIVDFTQESWKEEWYWLDQDCTRLKAKLVAASVTPPTAPTLVGHLIADRSQWLAYHNALVSACAAHSLPYLSATGQ